MEFSDTSGINKRRVYLYLVLIFSQFIVCAFASTLDNDLNSLTDTQRLSLEKFKQRMLNKLPHDYMKEDIYLIRWLRAKNYNVDLAEQMLNDNLKWRKTNKMDTILQEDWSEFYEKYPYHIDTVAKNGNPIITGDLGDWDLRSATVAGKLPKLIRYLDKAMEEGALTARKFRAQGKNVTQFDFFVNLDNYNVVQHGCLQCLPFYLGLVNSYENHFPSFADHIVLFNTPPVFEVILKAIRPILSPITRKSVKVRGQDKEAWSKILLDIADKSQLTPEYGGTYKRHE